jgi:hypothetical protein
MSINTLPNDVVTALPNDDNVSVLPNDIVSALPRDVLVLLLVEYVTKHDPQAAKNFMFSSKTLYHKIPADIRQFICQSLIEWHHKIPVMMKYITLLPEYYRSTLEYKKSLSKCKDSDIIRCLKCKCMLLKSNWIRHLSTECWTKGNCVYCGKKYSNAEPTHIKRNVIYYCGQFYQLQPMLGAGGIPTGYYQKIHKENPFEICRLAISDTNLQCSVYSNDYVGFKRNQVSFFTNNTKPTIIDRK